MLPWLACGGKNNLKDLCIASKVLEFIGVVSNPEAEALARIIHDASISCMPEVDRKNHPHAKHTWEDHDDEGRHEHLTQANLVFDVLKSMTSNQ